jgi:hypothetical protein
MKGSNLDAYRFVSGKWIPAPSTLLRTGFAGMTIQLFSDLLDASDEAEDGRRVSAP